MRHLFLLLLAVNIGLFVWGYQRELLSGQTAPRPRPDVGHLRLLSERPPLPTPEPPPVPEAAEDTAPAAQDAVEADPAAGAADIRMEHAEPAESVVGIESLLPEEPSGAVRQEAEAVDREEGEERPSVKEVTAVGRPAEDPSSQPEEVAGPDPDLATGPAPRVEAAVPEPPPSICYRLGPVTALAPAEGLAGHLAQLGLDVVIHRRVVMQPKGYWVMLPPQASYAQARKRLQELKAAGISDLWLFHKGAYKNAISLGLYSRLSNAEAARSAAREKGVEAVVQPRQVQMEQYWLGFWSAQRPPLAEESRLALQEAYPEENFTLQPCPAVVTP